MGRGQGLNLYELSIFMQNVQAVARPKSLTSAPLTPPYLSVTGLAQTRVHCVGLHKARDLRNRQKKNKLEKLQNLTRR
jgi:hypothetical protein